ncbi:MAG: OmpA family protein [Bacteroidota bacterium]
MSNIMKFFVMAIAWLLFTLLTFYTCVKPECCGEAEVIEEPIAPPITDDYAIVSSTGSEEVLTGSQWGALRDQLIAKYNADPNQILEIYGHFYDSEPKPDGYDNMGFLRADKIKDILVSAGIPADKIRTLARRMTDAVPAAEERWPAGTFTWAKADVDDEVIEIDKDHIKIRFPFDESTSRLSADTENYLKTLAERLQQTEETVTIVGHTDWIDTDEYNMRLGQKRADFVKARLVNYGAPGDRISTSSQGESNPEADNKTSEGRRLNRRAEITLNRQ